LSLCDNPTLVTNFSSFSSHHPAITYSSDAVSPQSDLSTPNLFIAQMSNFHSSIDGSLDTISVSDGASTIDLSGSIRPSIDESLVCPPDDLGAFGAHHSVTTKSVNRSSQTPVPIFCSIPRDTHFSSSTFYQPSGLTVDTNTITIVTNPSVLVTERDGDSVVRYHAAFLVIEPPSSPLRVGVKVMADNVHGKLVRVFDIRKGQVWFSCREVDEAMCFVVMDMEHVRLPWHWRLKLFVRYLRDRWKNWRTQRL
jgi:hypothetical protein